MRHPKKRRQTKSKSQTLLTIQKKSQKSQLRIIAGKYRGRKLTFQSSEGLRPTLDQVRETLFNWLLADISGVKCLDLFAGSGALGLEALSRGASSVNFIDSNEKAILNIKRNLNLLSDQSANCFCQKAEDFIKTTTKKYDLIFVDPPFGANLLEKTLDSVKTILANDALVYIEMESNLDLAFLENHWKILKIKSTQRFSYALIQIST